MINLIPSATGVNCVGDLPLETDNALGAQFCLALHQVRKKPLFCRFPNNTDQWRERVGRLEEAFDLANKRLGLKNSFIVAYCGRRYDDETKETEPFFSLAFVKPFGDDKDDRRNWFNMVVWLEDNLSDYDKRTLVALVSGFAEDEVEQSKESFGRNDAIEERRALLVELMQLGREKENEESQTDAALSFVGDYFVERVSLTINDQTCVAEIVYFSVDVGDDDENGNNLGWNSYRFTLDEDDEELDELADDYDRKNVWEILEKPTDLGIVDRWANWKLF